MKEMKIAQIAYENALEKLSDFVSDNTRLNATISEAEYPFRVTFYPDRQVTLLDTILQDNISDDGEIGFLEITVGLTTEVKSTLKFEMDSAVLKKLIRLVEKTGDIYYQAYRESGDGRRMGGCGPDGCAERICEKT